MAPPPCPPLLAQRTRMLMRAGGQEGANPKLYYPRQPERTLLYQTIAEHFETCFELDSAGQFNGQGNHQNPNPYVRQASHKYLECGIFAHGFAGAWAVMTSDTTNVWPIPAKAEASSPCAIPGAWWRQPCS